jgi:hypothetical protein
MISKPSAKAESTPHRRQRRTVPAVGPNRSRTQGLVLFVQRRGSSRQSRPSPRNLSDTRWLKGNQTSRSRHRLVPRSRVPSAATESARSDDPEGRRIGHGEQAKGSSRLCSSRSEDRRPNESAIRTHWSRTPVTRRPPRQPICDCSTRHCSWRRAGNDRLCGRSLLLGQGRAAE